MESSLKYFFNLFYLTFIGWLIYQDFSTALYFPSFFGIFLIVTKFRYISPSILIFTCFGSWFLLLIKCFGEIVNFVFKKERIASFLKYFNFEIFGSLEMLYDLMLISPAILIISMVIMLIIHNINQVLDSNSNLLNISINKNNSSIIFIKKLFVNLQHIMMISLFRIGILYLIGSFLLLTSHFIISVNILKNEFFKYDLILLTIELTNFQLKFLFNTAIIIIAYFKYKSSIELLKSLIELLTGKATPQ
jgi:hypothetical protein